MPRPGRSQFAVLVAAVAFLTIASACASTPAHRVRSDRASARIADITHEIDTICAVTDWITSRQTCDTLKAQIARAGAALGPGPHGPEVPKYRRGEAARRELTRFLELVEAGRADGSIHQNAFTILDALARDLRSGFAAPVRSPPGPR